MIAMDLECLETEVEEPEMVQMVQVEEIIQDSCSVTLDIGADVSVLPLCYGDVGTWRPGSKQLRMVDAQGTKIARQGLTKQGSKSLTTVERTSR